MKKLVILVPLLLSTISFAANKPNPADYPISVHVISSHRDINAVSLERDCSLDVTINGKQYEFAGFCQRANGHQMIIPLGDYKAKLITDEHPTPYQSYQTYELLFPDDKTVKFEVVGLTE